MTIRQTTITKLQKLPESLLPVVSDFIDFVMHEHQSKTADDEQQDDIAQAWEKWFKDVEQLEIEATEPTSEYQQLLLNKYRQQGLEL